MVHPQKLLYETSGKICLILIIFFVACKAGEVSGSEEFLPEDDVAKRLDTDGVAKHFGLKDGKAIYNRRYTSPEDDDMAKRALTLLARRWRPYLAMPKINTRSDFVSAVTGGGRRSRPLGQPLRWG